MFNESNNNLWSYYCKKYAKRLTYTILKLVQQYLVYVADNENNFLCKINSWEHMRNIESCILPVMRSEEICDEQRRNTSGILLYWAITVSSLTVKSLLTTALRTSATQREDDINPHYDHIKLKHICRKCCFFVAIDDGHPFPLLQLPGFPAISPSL